jgi:DNA polymerase III epsilon subunit family exonuclease
MKRVRWAAAAMFAAAAAWAAPPPTAPLDEVVFVAFDIETTGFGPSRQRIVELGAVRMAGGEIVEGRSWLINPGIPIPWHASRVHGIEDEDVAEAPSFKSVYREFLSFAGDAVLLAHNASFDTGFLRAEMVRSGLEPDGRPVIDSLPLFRNWFPEAPAHSIGELADYLNIEPGALHRAETDSEMVLRILALGLGQQPAGATLDDLLSAAGKLQSL